MDPRTSGSRLIRSGLGPLAVFLVFTAAAAWAGCAFFERLQQEEKAVAARTLASVGKLKAEQIRYYFERNQRFALWVGRLLGQGGLADWLDSIPTEMPGPLRESLLIVMRNRADSSLLVLDTSANIRFGAGPYAHLTEEGRRLALRAMTEPRPVTSDIYRGDPSAPEQALLDIFVRVQNPERDRAAGILVLRTDPAYLYGLIQTWPVESPTAELVLVRLDGDHALFLNELRFRKQTALRMQVPLSAGQSFPGWPSTAAVRGQVGIWEARDYRDHAILAYTLPVVGPVPGWGMVVKMDLTEVLAPVQRLKNTTVGVTVSFILLALLALGSWHWLLQKNADREIAERDRIGQINDQLEQRVRERTVELEHANLVLFESETRFRTLIEGVTDHAILMLGPDGRVASWNAGAQRLKGYRADEIIGQHFSRFYPEEDVARGKPERELQTAASEGRLEDEGWRVRQDGSRFWANVIITALRDETGQLRGFAKVTRDLTLRRQADEAVRASEARYHSTLDNMLESAQILGFDWRYLYLNEAAVRTAGQAKEEMLGHTVMERFPGFETTQMYAALRRCMEERTAARAELEFTFPEGTKGWFDFSIQPVPEGLFVLSLDITERKRAEEEQKQARAALARSEERFVALIEFAPDAMVISNAGGEIVLVNGQAERLFSYRREELLGKPVEILVPERFRGGHPGHRSSYVANPRVRAMGAGRDLYGLRKDGTEFPVEIGLSPLETEEGRLVSSAIRDVSERRQMDEALEFERSKLTAAFENTNMGLVLSDGQGGNISMNAAALRFHGFKSVAEMHEKIDEYADEWELRSLDGRLIPFTEWPLARAIRGESFRDCEIHLRNLESGYEWVCSYTGVPVRSSAGEVSLIVMTLLDITERKRMEERLRESNVELELRVQERTQALYATNKELEAFSYSVSHDLRAPLRAIDGFGQVLLQDHTGQLDAEGRGHLERIRAAAQRMGGLIDDMLTLSRIGRAELRRQEVNLSALVGEVAEELRRREPDRLVSLAIEPGLVARADPRLLRIALENLLGNAWKFTRNKPEARVSVELSETDGAAAYRIRDNGAGFDMAYADKLFTPFQRLHSLREFEGNGIGLAIVARVIHRHGGEIRAEGAVGLGATIHFTLGPSGAGADREEATL